MFGLKKTIPEKAVIIGLLTAILLSNAMFFSIHSKNPATESMEENNVEGVSTDFAGNIPSGERATRANNPYASSHFHPIYASDDDGGNPDYTNLDEDAPGDGVYENTGKDATYAWIECGYGPLNIPVGSIIHNMTVYIGYYNDIEWNISASHTGIIWSTTSGGTEWDIADYTLSTTDRDEVYIITSNLPTAIELNDGIHIRVSGYNISGQDDFLHLDYLYFTINYSIPEIVINEVMYNLTGSDDNAEWVELYNAGSTAVNFAGWNLTDNDGNRFTLTPAGSIPAGGYVVCHLAQSGANTSSEIYGQIETEILLQPNASIGKDNFLEFESPTDNKGTSSDLVLDTDVLAQQKPLIQFNLSTLPATGIKSAAVFLYRRDGSSSDGNVTVHRVTQNWTESGSNWNTSDGTNNWTNAGGDYNATVYDTTTVLGPTNGWYSWDITDMVKEWKNGTYQNYGMIFNGTEADKKQSFHSSDYTTDTSLRPKLVVEYNNPNTMLEDNDDLVLLDSSDNIIDYIVWGADAGTDDDDAVTAGQWNDGDYIDTSIFLEGQTLGRDMDSNDTDQPEDWKNATGYADPFGVDRSDSKGPSPGERNANQTLGGPAITGVSANPPTQYGGEYVNITCNVMDPDGVDSVWVNITLPGGGYINVSMTQGPGDQWYCNNTYAILGVHQFTIHANDTIGNWTEISILQFEVVNIEPILSLDLVNPAIGFTDTWFNFTVTYTDLDNHAPAIITVNITNFGTFDMVPVDSFDADYTDGNPYYYNVSGFANGTVYSFHFAASEIMGDWVETADMPGPQILNSPAFLVSPDINPLSGNSTTDFNFTVTYVDIDNNPTVSVTLNLTGPTGGTFALIEVDPFDVDYTNGKLYYYVASGLSIGSYSFHFAANETGGEWIESIVQVFNVLNLAPTLSLGQVTPAIGFDDTSFNFTVTYTDLDDQAPDTITVNITGLGIYQLNEVDSLDMDYSDGKTYYIEITVIPLGTSYTFHFAANDTLGNWAIETPEIDAPDVLQKSATLTALDETVEYSDIAYLNATLMESGTPIAGEDIEFYIDLNDNGIYEPGEIIGSATTLADGRVSVMYSAYLVPGTYNFTTVYIGLGGFNVNDGYGQITIIPKPASLTAVSRIAEENEVISLNATLTDSDGNPIAGEGVEIYLDKNRNLIYEGSEMMGYQTTSAGGVASITYTVTLSPGDYDIWARYRGSGNYSVTEIEGVLIVQNTTNTPPTILGIVPDQIRPEDSLPWTLDLTTYEADIENTGPDLKWFLTGVDTSLYSVTGYNSSDDVFTFIPKENAFGNDEVILWLVDGSGDWDSQVMWVNITPVNDVPYFDPKPPDIFVHYNDPGTADDDPSPWDYTFYVHDIETPKEGLAILTSEPTEDSGDGYAEVNDLNVTFHYPQSRVGDSILVTLTLYDGFDSTQTVIMVNVTSDWVPELVSQLPDITIEENTTIYNVFDLDDYFADRDHDSLFFSSGYQHLTVVINSDNTVDITAAGEWTGSELITFRAMNPTGAIVEDTITVTVLPVNDGPVISGAPDLIVHYDYSYGFDFTPYIEDPDNSHSEISLWTSELTDNIWIQGYNNLGIIVNYPESMDGMTFPVTIFVSDGVSTASQEIQITISDNFPPELMYSLPDVSFDEDTVFEDGILLSYYFLDIDGDALFFSNGSTFINVVINDDLTVDFSAPENWYGFETVTFRATDPTGSIAEDTILIVVVPVNDAPTIDSIPGQEKNEGDQWVLDLSQYIDDIDNDASELIITVESEAGQGYVTLTGDILVFRYPKEIDSDIVTIMVSDGELETQRSFTVTLKSHTPVAPSIWNLIPWHWVLLMFFVAFVGAFALYRKKNKYIVHEAFLIHEKGLPIAHASREEISELEDVVVSGMFTAVQDFISDAFSGKTQDDGWKLDEMKFGENKILIERSQDLYLAAIFEGNGSRLGNRMKKLLKDTDEKYSDVLTDWDGDMAQLVGISSAINALIYKKPSKHVDSEQTSVKYRSEIEGEEPEGPLTETGDLGELSTHANITPVEGDKNSLSEEVKISECPECYSEIRSGDVRCPICGLELSEMEDVDSALSGYEDGSEKDEFMHKGEGNGDDIRDSGDGL